MPRYRVVRAVTKNGTYYKAGEIVEVGESFGSSMTRLRFFALAGDPKPKATTKPKPARKPRVKKAESTKKA